LQARSLQYLVIGYKTEYTRINVLFSYVGFVCERMKEGKKQFNIYFNRRT